MPKIVINTCYGGFGLSEAAKKKLRREIYSWEYEHRTDPKLVAIVEKLGDKANGKYAELKVVEIPDGVDWTIEEYDGVEWVAEKHRTWR